MSHECCMVAVCNTDNFMSIGLSYHKQTVKNFKETPLKLHETRIFVLFQKLFQL